MMALTDTIRVGVNAAYLDASYGDFRDGPCTAIQLDASRAGAWRRRRSVAQPAALANPNPGPNDINDLTGRRTLYASEWSGNAFIVFPCRWVIWSGLVAST
ncbi:MAG: hypothetical protein CM15mP74_17780 [Halieaceae bacterium]|nr:MAG: hypothetical protein CM15mP74_17780 [Halieaceae bacterium]